MSQRGRSRTAPTYNRGQTLHNMKILISNDDGYQAAGLVALYDALKDVCLLYTSDAADE